MGFQRVVLLLLLCAAAVLATSEPVIPLPSIKDELTRRGDLECIGDQTGRWRKDCNWCSCRNGRETCTRRMCPQGTQDTASDQCEGNAAWRKECNTCACEDGRAACTLRACIGDRHVGNERKGSQTPSVQSKECEEGSRWRVGCNWCQCEDGRKHCTEDSCEDWNEAKAREYGIMECHDMSRWKDECNWCSCFNGRARCTKKACIPPERDPFHRLPPNALCVPGSRWMVECNWCNCGEEGQAACTLMGCLPGYRNDGPTCEEGSVWRVDDCNTCRCIDGKAACTERLCLTPQAVPKELECQGDSRNDRWRMDCNWCRCLDGIGTCTRRTCVEGVEDSAPACEGNPSWMRDCNRCTCLNGTAVCTTKFCDMLPPQVGPSRGGPRPEPQCTGEDEGDTWTDECNMCRCRNGVPGCTKRMCRPGEDRTPVCTGNASWKQDCNVCRCSNGNVVCTKRFCGELPSQVGPSRGAPRSEPQCTGEDEGDTWTNECNMCRCRNGVPGCTKRMCRPGEDRTPVCTGNPSWKQDCNVCRCSNGNVVCTKRFCDTQGGLKSTRRVGVNSVKKEQEPVCVDGSRWRDRCNWCTCSNGLALCTLKSCLDTQAKSDEPECEGDATWKQDCNWCTCGDGLAVCTRMACLKEDTVCIEGTTWFDGCNLCRCSHGFTLCTKKACITHENKLECKGDSCGPAELPPLCHLPPMEGQLQCTAFFMKWTFSASDKACKQIVYGGCGGTANLFDTEDDCKAACPTTTTITAKGKSNAVMPVIPIHYEGPSKKGTVDRCHLVPDSGPCFGFMTRYAFNPKTGLCEEFVFGGCAGNSNNFASEDECLAACEGKKVCDKSKCPWSLWGHYLAMECVPQYTGNSCCPISFQCPSASEGGKGSSQSCYYKGATYNLGESVPVTAPCSAACICAESHQPDAPAQIRCANVECPELFQPTMLGCRALYKIDQCCAYDFICGDPLLPPQQPRADASCSWHNKTYHYGSTMYFDDYPCQKCVCGPDFTDPTGPGCRKIDCGFDFRYNDRYRQGCVPILFELDGCCPIDWMCPDDSRIDDQHSQDHQHTHSTDESSVCHLGDRRLAVGEVLGLTECKIECRCMTPPELTCIQYRSCELAQKTATERACPSPQCEPGCHLVVENPGGCPTCSCSTEVFSCPALTCPGNCDQEVDADTGCLTCRCRCDREMVCPTGCPFHTVMNESTGCPKCECKPGTLRVAPDDCPSYPNGEVPCPMDCAIIRTVDDNGCEVCRCDPDNPGNPFRPPPLQPKRYCPRAGEAPCPMDCGIIRTVDENGCEVCRCDPNNPGNPFRPSPLQPKRYCPRAGEAPCPMDCGIIRTVDDNGCEVCRCDPNNPGNPFRPPPLQPKRYCPRAGEAPCPMDCAIIRSMDENGCEVCRCDPDNPGNPFNPIRPLPPCPSEEDAPCPADCPVKIYTDENGCGVCECDQVYKGRPFS